MTCATGVGVTGVPGRVTGVEAREDVGAGDTEVVHGVQTCDEP